MTDPGIDDPAGEWCYLAKSTTVIGVPYQPDVTQITYDGALFTRNAELCFFLGPQDRPVLARSKTFLDGWIPIVQFTNSDGNNTITAQFECFAFTLDGESADNTVNFVQVTLHNHGTQPAPARLTAALRHNGGDYRFGGAPFSPAWHYAMTDSSAVRDGKLVYSFNPGAQRQAVPGINYTQPFAGSTHALTPRAETCLARYDHTLDPGASVELTFKMPRVPVPSTNTTFLDTLAHADYRTYRARTIAFWQNLFANCATFEFPESRVQNAHRAGLVHLLLGTRNLNGRLLQTDGLPYPDFFLTSVPEITLHCLTSGFPDHARNRLIPDAIAQQQDDGLYFDRAVAQGRIIPATQGHTLYSIAMTVLFTQDRPLARRVYPSVQRAVAFIDRSVQTNEHGLLPRCWPYDAEMIDGHYTGQNLFALMGVRSAVRVARFLGQSTDASAWSILAARYEANLLRALAASARTNGYIPTGLYDLVSGPDAPRGFAHYQCNSDWENMLLAYPTEVLDPADPRVQGTLDQVRQGYAEGIMTYRHGQHLHQYITSNMIEQYLARGDTYTALKDFYHQLLHSGPTAESFENLVVPWTDRQVDPGCPPPHVWGTAKQALTVRNLVLLEYGGRCGLDPDRRELWLFHCLSPAWVQPGRHVACRNAPTEFGTVSATITFTPTGAAVTLTNRFHSPPVACRLRVPYFKELIRFDTDAHQHRRDGDSILVSPDATRVTFEWRDKPDAHQGTVTNILTDYRTANRFAGVDTQGRAILEPGRPFLLDSENTPAPQPLSFDLVRNTFQHEYRRRVAATRDAGVPIRSVAAPELLTSQERTNRFTAEFGAFLSVSNLVTGCPTAATAQLPNHAPELATDGNVSLDSSWQADPYPQTLEVDLRQTRRLKAVHVWPYWGANRYYQYTVELSTDRQTWNLIGDKRTNTTPATPAGDPFPFPPHDARYIRIRVLFHSLNPGVHLVEIAAMGTE